MTNHARIAFAGGLVLLAVSLLLSSCSVTGATGNSNTIASEAGLYASLPQLPQDRVAMAGDPPILDPQIYAFSGGTVADQGADLLIDSDAGSVSWAMYSFATGGEDMESLEMVLSYPQGSGGWLALGNYATSRWDWISLDGNESPSIPLPMEAGKDYTSAAGTFYFVLLSFDGNDLLVQGLEVTAPAGVPTYNADIAPLLDGSTGENSCTGCHGGISPNLETYANVSANASAVLDSVSKTSGFMPPGQRWSEDNIALFQAWIDGGKPEM